MLKLPWLDSHCHLWKLQRGDYDWLDPQDPELAIIAKDFAYSDLLSAYGSTDVRESIVVQAAASDAETDYLLSLALEHASILGVVGWVDLGHSNLAERLGILSSNSLCLGIRPMLQDIPDTDWILQSSQQAGLAKLEQSDLCLDALITSRHMEVLLKTCLAYPELPVIIDHAAKPDLSDPNSTAFEKWSEGMQRLASETSAMCKVSGLLSEMSQAQRQKKQQTLALLQRVFDQLLEYFGPTRLVWGSDWPVLTLAADFEDWFDISCQLLAPLSTEEQQDIVRANAMRFYGLDEEMG